MIARPSVAKAMEGERIRLIGLVYKDAKTHAPARVFAFFTIYGISHTPPAHANSFFISDSSCRSYATSFE